MGNKLVKQHVNTSPVTAHTEYEETNHVRTELNYQQTHGIFEAESCTEELDLHTHMDACQKNPGHKGFIPVSKFTVGHLPARYQDDDLVPLIKTLADLTVRVSVKHTSTERPDCYPGTTKPFPAAELKGTRSMRTGSGWVSGVDIHQWPDLTEEDSCPCQECRGSKRQWQPWARIEICTAAHLVYDKNEAAHTTCHFFYDTNDTHLDDIPSLHGATLLRSDVDGDYCWMEYTTHEIDLANKLETKVKLYRSFCEHVHKRYGGRYRKNKLTIIVSHPHGCSKQISFGELVKEEQFGGPGTWYNSRYKYTTPTCPGSSGGLVLVLCLDQRLVFDHPHGGQCEDNLNLNYSGNWLFFMPGHWHCFVTAFNHGSLCN